jgi:hypothetical protein
VLSRARPHLLHQSGAKLCGDELLDHQIAIVIQEGPLFRSKSVIQSVLVLPQPRQLLRCEIQRVLCLQCGDRFREIPQFASSACAHVRGIIAGLCAAVLKVMSKLLGLGGTYQSGSNVEEKYCVYLLVELDGFGEIAFQLRRFALLI